VPSTDSASISHGESGLRVVGLSRRIPFGCLEQFRISSRRSGHFRLAASTSGTSSPPAWRRFPVLAARPRDRAPLLGFPKIAHPSTPASCVHSCTGPSCEVAFTFRLCASACSCHGSGPVPPSRFLTVLMVCSAESLAGLLHPAANPWVRRVSGFFLRSLAGSSDWAVPSGASTLRSFFPRLQPSPFFPFWESLPSCRYPLSSLIRGSSLPLRGPEVLRPFGSRCGCWRRHRPASGF
jgi:hypothetical protein